ncbi:MAG: spermidine/putrescine ABC transporter ATP-binding protein [Candidatus Entotheonella gemina]|uniref:Spermidine/putrescine import ATP-binding protein PotA n=1 Tax=Candidatus Entotheonella gemina TaxID=1429439 RepID=W4M811_9BACT|nr:MAG: spermidine/putrescine ABC transporter ATP-binding protein [Candidatus Entotheonella gemina]
MLADSAVHDAYVRFADVQKSYDGETLVIKDLNLDIAQGEFVTLLGPSGSGKTTSLMMLAGFEAPTQGQIFLDGSPINHVAPHRRGIGMVFQNYALFPHMTVAENVAFPLRVRRVRKAQAAELVQQALDMVQLGDLGTRRPAQLSGGQQQRVALARALVFEPKLVLMDEPLGALDKQLREHMQYEIKHIHEHLGLTVVYVTHDQSEALTMSNRIAVFDDGVIQQLASPENLYEAPQNAFVAQFIGENNTLMGQVTDCDGRICEVALDGGGTVRALAINVESKGGRTTLSLRPERVVLNPQTGCCPNVFEAKVEERIYLGDHMRTRIHVCGTSEFIVKVPNATGRIALQPGDTVTVGWQTEDCRALDAPA